MANKSQKDRNGKLIYVSDEAYEKIAALADKGHRPKSMQVELMTNYYIENVADDGSDEEV